MELFIVCLFCANQGFDHYQIDVILTQMLGIVKAASLVSFYQELGFMDASLIKFELLVNFVQSVHVVVHQQLSKLVSLSLIYL